MDYILAAGAELRTLSALACERARWIIADCLPVIATGMQQPEMKALAAKHLARAGGGNAWVVGTGKRAPAFDAALAAPLNSLLRNLLGKVAGRIPT